MVNKWRRALTAHLHGQAYIHIHPHTDTQLHTHMSTYAHTHTYIPHIHACTQHIHICHASPPLDKGLIQTHNMRSHWKLWDNFDCNLKNCAEKKIHLYRCLLWVFDILQVNHWESIIGSETWMMHFFQVYLLETLLLKFFYCSRCVKEMFCTLIIILQMGEEYQRS